MSYTLEKRYDLILIRQLSVGKSKLPTIIKYLYTITIKNKHFQEIYTLSWGSYKESIIFIFIFNIIPLHESTN